MDDLIEIFSQKNSTVEDKLDALTDWLEEVKNELNEGYLLYFVNHS